jgi:hypothetical protein
LIDAHKKLETRVQPEFAEQALGPLREQINELQRNLDACRNSSNIAVVADAERSEYVASLVTTNSTLTRVLDSINALKFTFDDLV